MIMIALRQSFLCFELETGGIFIGWLLLLLNIGFSIFFLYVITDRFTNAAVSMNNKVTEEQHPTFFLFMYLLIFVVMSLMSYEVGVNAVKKRKVNALRFSRFYWTLLAGISAILMIVAFISGRITKDPIIVKLILAIGTVCAIVFTYFAVVISSLIAKFSENDNDGNETEVALNQLNQDNNKV